METYILRDKAVEAVQHQRSPNRSPAQRYMLSLIHQELRDIPAADVAPVSHSYWEGYSCSQYMGTDEFGEPKWRDGRFYVCHDYRCRRKTVVKSAYCPNCGARMDGDPDA